jgi:dipeptide/tripeptide permease
MLIRRIAAMAGLPLVAVLESCAYFMGLTMLTMLLQDDLGMDVETASGMHSWLQSISLGALFLGGLLAAGTGPLITLILGIALSVVGFALLPFMDASLVMVPVVVLALGQGLKRPSLWAAAAQPFGFPRENLRSVSILLSYIGFNLGALVASPLAQAVRDAAGTRVVLFVAAGLMALAAVLAAGVGAAWLVRRDQVAREQEAPRPAQGRVLLGAAVLAVLAFLPTLCWQRSWDLQMNVLHGLEGHMSWDLFFAINPSVVITVGFLLAAILGGLHVARVRLPAMALVGLGLLLLGLGTAPLLLPGIGATLPALLASAAVLSFGEVLAIPFFTSRLVGDVHGRLAPLLVAVWIALTGGGSQLLAWLSDSGALPYLRPVTGWVGVGSGLLCGLALLIAAFLLQRRLYEPQA